MFHSCGGWRQWFLVLPLAGLVLPRPHEMGTTAPSRQGQLTAVCLNRYRLLEVESSSFSSWAALVFQPSMRWIVSEGCWEASCKRWEARPAADCKRQWTVNGEVSRWGILGGVLQDPTPRPPQALRDAACTKRQPWAR